MADIFTTIEPVDLATVIFKRSVDTVACAAHEAFFSPIIQFIIERTCVKKHKSKLLN